MSTRARGTKTRASPSYTAIQEATRPCELVGGTCSGQSMGAIVELPVGGNFEPPETPPHAPQVAAGDGRRAQLLSTVGRGACWGDVDRLGDVSTREEATGTR